MLDFKEVKTYLITGGSGFLGTHLSHELLRRGQKVKVLDIAPLSDMDLVGKVEFYQGDVRNSVLVNRLIKNVDVVLHCAAALPLWSNKEIYSTNIEGTRVILEAAHQNNKKRVVYISSTAVYGVPEKHPLYETDSLVGVGAYGESKIAAENLCLDYRKKGLSVAIVRPKTFIGVGRLGVFQILFEWVKDGKKIPIIGNGKNHYQLLAVSDLVDFILKVASANDMVANDTYNVGAKKFGTVSEDFMTLFNFAKSGSKLRTTPPRFVKFWLWIFEKMGLSPLYKWVYGTADKDSFVSIEKAEKFLGWNPKLSNAQALIETYDWYVKHWKDYQNRQGVTHTVPWKQGILKIVKWLS